MHAQQLEFQLVAFEPCPQFRLPVEGDLFTCRDCGYWVEEHDDA